MIERWGAFVARRAVAVLLAGLAVVVAAGLRCLGAGLHLGAQFILQLVDTRSLHRLR